MWLESAAGSHQDQISSSGLVQIQQTCALPATRSVTVKAANELMFQDGFLRSIFAPLWPDLTREWADAYAQADAAAEPGGDWQTALSSFTQTGEAPNICSRSESET